MTRPYNKIHRFGILSARKVGKKCGKKDRAEKCPSMSPKDKDYHRKWCRERGLISPLRKKVKGGVI